VKLQNNFWDGELILDDDLMAVVELEDVNDSDNRAVVYSVVVALMIINDVEDVEESHKHYLKVLTPQAMEDVIDGPAVGDVLDELVVELI
jgi:DNA/RNA-binding domain of Phe-tRNA-synthetase-like protein